MKMNDFDVTFGGETKFLRRTNSSNFGERHYERKALGIRQMFPSKRHRGRMQSKSVLYTKHNESTTEGRKFNSNLLEKTTEILTNINTASGEHGILKFNPPFTLSQEYANKNKKDGLQQRICHFQLDTEKDPQTPCFPSELFELPSRKVKNKMAIPINKQYLFSKIALHPQGCALSNTKPQRGLSFENYYRSTIAKKHTLNSLNITFRELSRPEPVQSKEMSVHYKEGLTERNGRGGTTHLLNPLRMKIMHVSNTKKGMRGYCHPGLPPIHFHL